MTSRPVGRRGLVLGAGTLFVSGLLAACSDEPAPPPAPPTGKELAEPTPVQTEEQFTTIVGEVNADVVEADEARDASLLSPRVSGSAVHFRKASYALIEKSDEFAAELTVPGAELVVPMSSVTSDFPRVAIALVEDSAEDGVPYFMALQQSDAKSSYTSWGWAQQAVGIEMPTVPSALKGSEQVAVDDESLVMTPAAALSLYAKVLTDGDRADPDDQLAPNPFQTGVHEGIQAERAKLNEGVERDEAATVRESYAVKEEEFAGLRTDDGGAVVLGTLLSTRTVTVAEGATVRYTEENRFTTVIGRTEFTSKYVRTYGTHVALYIPSADGGGQVQPIGATRTTLTASGE
ncbi:hypothetical protein [Brachybacterium sp. YJGR34]|uniref:hypothetical protein n=1 Tax=Brachybacterium sp. YJGR34 TaxID=2059911 RepID=UPI001E32FBD8|nr:hypothetical protein [Brachybacterium sp. YJGR34]